MKDKNNKINTNFCQRLTLYLTNTLYFLSKKYTAKQSGYFPWLGAPLLFFLRIFIPSGPGQFSTANFDRHGYRDLNRVRRPPAISLTESATPVKSPEKYHHSHQRNLSQTVIYLDPNTRMPFYLPKNIIQATLESI